MGEQAVIRIRMLVTTTRPEQRYIEGEHYVVPERDAEAFCDAQLAVLAPIKRQVPVRQAEQPAQRG